MNTKRKEKVAVELLNNLYHMARDTHPLTPESAELLTGAAGFRKECEDDALPMVTFITPGTVSCFTGLLPEDLAEEIRVRKRRGIGLLRIGEDGTLCAAAAAVFSIDTEEVADRRILRISWLYVHPMFRGKGLGNAMLAELMNYLHSEGISGATIDLADSEEPTLLKELLSKWHFSFVTGLEPDFILRVSDIGDTKEMTAMTGDVTPLSAMSPREAWKLIRRVYERDGYEGFLAGVEDAYIDRDLSCYIAGDGLPMAMALVHISPQGRILVEYVHTEPGDEVLTVNLVIYIALVARIRFGDDAILRMKTESYEINHLLSKTFPKQMTVYLDEGILN